MQGRSSSCLPPLCSAPPQPPSPNPMLRMLPIPRTDIHRCRRSHPRPRRCRLPTTTCCPLPIGSPMPLVSRSPIHCRFNRSRLAHQRALCSSTLASTLHDDVNLIENVVAKRKHGETIECRDGERCLRDSM
mmetsp:Transcript_338/g.497  ORF Transcript_338/g.497 Transcript_338/m.497 type:complete len:131 (+) Transcript_338:132-524(+)